MKITASTRQKNSRESPCAARTVVKMIATAAH